MFDLCFHTELLTDICEMKKLDVNMKAVSFNPRPVSEYRPGSGGPSP
jgi:hypothetical protein